MSTNNPFTGSPFLPEANTFAVRKAYGGRSADPLLVGVDVCLSYRDWCTMKNQSWFPQLLEFLDSQQIRERDIEIHKGQDSMEILR